MKSPLTGKRVRLILCTDTYTHLPAGLEGTVSFVDDTGTVHVHWDNGSRLGLCPDAGDRFEVIEPVRHRPSGDHELRHNMARWQRELKR
jgi:hypothetical protein